MSHPRHIVSNQKEEFISIQRVKYLYCTCFHDCPLMLFAPIALNPSLNGYANIVDPDEMPHHAAFYTSGPGNI